VIFGVGFTRFIWVFIGFGESGCWCIFDMLGFVNSDAPVVVRLYCILLIEEDELFCWAAYLASYYFDLGFLYT
jgi:hypothetical protein